MMENVREIAITFAYPMGSHLLNIADPSIALCE